MMNISMKHQLNYLSIFYILLLLMTVSAYVFLFWNLPLSEDAGYYAFLSKSMLHGMVLHNDVPATTNSLLIYITTGFFKIFGANKLTYRMIYAFGYGLLVLGIYKLVSSQRSIHEGFIASFICAVLVMIPHIMLDLGRNQIIWSMALIVIGLYFKFKYQRNFIFGLCLAIAAIMRETFLVVILAYDLVLAVRIILNIRHDEIRQSVTREFLFFNFGAASGLLLNAILLTYYHSWGNYFVDMLQSGASFRYHGISRFKHYLDNIHVFNYGYVDFYRPILVFGFLSFLYPAPKGSLINWLKYFFLPIFFFEAVFVNKTETYSIVPMLVVFVILAVYFWFELIKKTYYSSPYNMNHWRSFGLLCASIFYAGISLPASEHNIFGNYHDYYSVLHADQASLANGATERTKSIIENLPRTSEIGTSSMYPLVFEIPQQVDYHFPYLFDFSAPANLGRPALAVAQKAAFQNQKTDIFVLKGGPNNTIYEAYDHYLIVADFDASKETTVTSYNNRILISKKFFKKNFHEELIKKNIEFKQSTKISNPNSQAIIIRVGLDPKSCISSVQLKDGLSRVAFNQHDYLKPELYSLVLPHSTLTIEKVHACPESKDPKITIDFFKRHNSKWRSKH